MAEKSNILQRLGLGIVFGIFGFILGTILGTIGIFPALQWGPIGLFLGIIFGAFKDDLGF